MSIRPGFVVGLFFALTACAVYKTPHLPPDPWQMACEATWAHYKYVCPPLQPTVLVTSTLPDNEYGEYRFGEDFIRVHVGLPPSKRTIVTVHEFTHYIQWYNAQVYNSREAACRAEEEAFTISYETSVKLGEPDTQWSQIAWVYGCMSQLPGMLNVFQDP